MKMKRKELEEQVNDDFSDFSLSSPATKIRRLDIGGGGFDRPVYGLAPIMEEEPMLMQSVVSMEELKQNCDALPPVVNNEERAIVLFKPPSMTTAALVRTPSGFSLSSDILSGLKNQLWSRQSPYLNSSLGDEASLNNNCLAVIPWVPAQVLGQEGVQTMEVMGAEDVGEAMEIEQDNNTSIIDGQLSEPGGMMASESLNQWQQQQHCMTPQLPQNIPTPVVWYQ